MKSNTTFLLAGTLMGTAAAVAGTTDIANVPLMNINGTSTVHPNIMLMLDDSGSMAFQYTPDYVTGAGSVSRPGGQNTPAVRPTSRWR